VRTLRTDLEIEAPADRVWTVLTDFERYPEWNPFVRSLSGPLAVGERLRAHLQAEGGTSFRVRPRVVTVAPGREFAWLGRLGIPGLFDGEHRFRIEPLADGGRVRFVHEEHFRGILVPLLWGKLDTETRRGFEQMNEALKQRVEGAGRTAREHGGS
jgi:hypothetical protein